MCCGSGGVGKTTTAAALALRAAERGRSVVVLTIDPARRLAQSLGLNALDNTPAPVEAGPAVAAAGGRLDAMMLDMKRTFDEVVEAHASPEKARQILANPFYVALSSSFAGTQEYMAMEKLGQLHARAHEDRGWDLIVVDTPPSRSALDFLDAPEHLSSLLDGRFIRLLIAPARGPARLLSAGLGVVTGTLTKVLGAQVLRDVQTFVAAFDTLFGGFRQRAERYVRTAAGAADGIRRGGDARARRAARGGLLRGAAERGPDATGRPGAEPRHGRRGAAAEPRPRAAGGRAARRRDRRPRTGACGGAGSAPAARRAGAHPRPAAAAGPPLQCRAPLGGDGRRACAGRRRARRRRAAPDRRAAGASRRGCRRLPAAWSALPDQR